MCCGDKCLCFVPIKTASLIFGFIIAVISALGTVVSTGVWLLSIAFLVTGTGAEVGYIMSSFFAVEFTSSFVCSVLLLVGITQNKPKLVMVFLIYGMIQIVLLLTFFVMLSYVNNFSVPIIFLLIAGLIIYGLFLYMVFVHYRIMIAQPEFVNVPSQPNVYVDLHKHLGDTPHRV